MDNLAKIATTAQILEKVKLGKNIAIGDHSIIGYKSHQSQVKHMPTIISNNCNIGSHVIINHGTSIKDEVHIEDFTRIGEFVKIGAKSRIIYGQKIYDNVEIGKNAIIGGFVCERAKIGNNARMFGYLVHKHNDPIHGWDDDKGQEESPILKDYVIVGFGAKVMGEITIGRKSYIMAGAIVTRDVPTKHVVYGVNKMVPFNEWKGDLSKSKFFDG